MQLLISLILLDSSQFKTARMISYMSVLSDFDADLVKGNDKDPRVKLVTENGKIEIDRRLLRLLSRAVMRNSEI